MMFRSNQGFQEVTDYSSDTGCNASNNNFAAGYSSDTGHRQTNRSQNYNVSNGYSSDTGYRNTSTTQMPRPRINKSTSQPLPSATPHDGYHSDAPPSTIQRDDSGRSIVSGITMADDSDDRITPPSSWDEDGVECFHIKADLWNVYESEGYPYYLRMRDNHSQWEDPRVVGVEGEEVEVVAPPKTSHPAPDEYKQSLRQERQGQEAKQSDDSVHRNLKVQTQYTKPPAHNPLTFPTSMPGVGATFINVQKASPVNFPSSNSNRNPPHTHHPLVSDLKPPVSAAEVFASKAVQGDGFVEAKSEIDDDFQEAKEPPTPEKSGQPLAAMLQARAGGGAAEAKRAGGNALEAALQAKIGGGGAKSTEEANFSAKVEAKPDAKSESVHMSKDNLMKDEETKKYVKMASVGVPPESVAQKMETDGIDRSKISSFRAAFNIASNEDTEDSEAQEKLEPSLTKDGLLAIPEVAKYVRMTKMGVPPMAVSQKMTKDGVEKANILKFEVTFGLAVAPASKLNSAIPLAKRRTTVKMTKVHMKSISSDKLKNSLWGAEDTKNDDDELAKDDIKALEEVFGQSSIAKSPLKGAKQTDPSTPSKRKEVALVDSKRAYNVNIGLAQFKSSFAEDYDALMEAVASLDESKLNAENLANLKSLLPSSTEMRQVALYKGDTTSLGRCERFFISAGRSPGIVKINDSFHIILSFNESLAASMKKFKAVNFACKQIVDSKSLTPLLKKVLAVGNLMNEANNKPKATGITLESLVKICLTKGSDKKTTVMDYVVQMFLEKEGIEGARILKIGEELMGLKDGARIKSMKGLYKELDDLRHGMKLVKMCRDEAGKEAPRFVSGSSSFLTRASSLLSELEEASNSTKDSTSSLYQYFGEDEKRTECGFIMSVLIQFVGLVKKSMETYERRKRRKKLEKEREERKAAAAAASASQSKDTPPAVAGGQFGSSRGGRSQAKMAPPPRPPPTNPNHSFNTNLLTQAMDRRRSSIQGWSAGEPKVAEVKLDEDKEGDDGSDDEWLDAEA